jgi:hypothetical protein
VPGKSGLSTWKPFGLAILAPKGLPCTEQRLKPRGAGQILQKMELKSRKNGLDAHEKTLTCD